MKLVSQYEIRPKPVSIPKRVSEALKLNNWVSKSNPWMVSIPKRVSEALKPDNDGNGTIDEIALFQSLKGFQRL